MAEEEYHRDDQDPRRTPPQIKQLAEMACKQLLPEKSSRLNEKNYGDLLEWCTEQHIDTDGDVSETVLLAYFHRESLKFKPSTLWCKYSKLRACLNLRKNSSFH